MGKYIYKWALRIFNSLLVAAHSDRAFWIFNSGALGILKNDFFLKKYIIPLYYTKKNIKNQIRDFLMWR